MCSRVIRQIIIYNFVTLSVIHWSVLVVVAQGRKQNRVTFVAGLIAPSIEANADLALIKIFGIQHTVIVRSILA